MSSIRRVQDWVTILAGVWLVASPWILGFSGTAGAAWNAWILGALAVIVAVWAMVASAPRNAEWVGLLVGAWLFVSPWILGHMDLSTIRMNAWILGAIIVLASAWGILAPAESKGKAKPVA